jgi:hypothetical protein
MASDIFFQHQYSLSQEYRKPDGYSFSILGRYLFSVFCREGIYSVDFFDWDAGGRNHGKTAEDSEYGYPKGWNQTAYTGR